MERLTKHWGNNYVATKLDYCSLLEIPDEDFKCFEAIVKKLAEYEDLEEQGLLLKLPCKVGDTIYELKYPTRVDADGKEWTVLTRKGMTVEPLKFALCHLASIGKLYFATKEEAEKALEMEK